MDGHMNHDRYGDDWIAGVLRDVKTIAIVGASPKEIRPSYFVLRYLIEKGYRVFAVNPGHAGRKIGAADTYASLAEIPEPIDMVDIFRSSDAAAGVVDEALALPTVPKVIWMQLGVRNDDAAAKAEYGRLSGEIAWTGVNRRTISARKPTMSAGGVQRLSLPPGVRAKAPD